MSKSHWDVVRFRVVVEALATAASQEVTRFREGRFREQLIFAFDINTLNELI
jgi:hypothetical protein